MKIVLTGSLGHIGKPLTHGLVQKGHDVTVISSNPEKQKEIETLGATAAIGTLQDADFLAATFIGADAIYTMVPPTNYLNPNLDITAYCVGIGNNFAEAIKRSNVKRVVHLSSIGAHMEKGSGLILSHRAVEDILNGLSDVAITFIRPSGFYYNLFTFIPVIKKAGVIAANYGADEMLIWVAPIDIVAAIAEELETPLVGKKVRYVGSDELTGHETARILGEAIGIPDLQWVLIPGEQWQSGMVAAGVNPQVAAGLVEMFAAQHSGALTEDYYRHKPAVMGRVKITEFAQEFAAAFNQM